ncbi:MAG: enoyl-CoA hydratase/isomerase family protein [Phycisphaerales bacterium]|nr:enoyl-CoA hydratase/isomerase family protein [Phycisphaerales bacterium]
MSDLAKVEVSGRIARLVINRPEIRNALSVELLEALHARVDELVRREDVSVLLVTGEGKAFCAGMDLKHVIDDPAPEAPARLLLSLAELTLKLRDLPMVTCAIVNGAAIGGGCGLVCVCDLAVTHESSKMGFPEVDLGVCPAVVAPWLVRKIGAGRARRVLLSGGLMSGREAYEIGIVDAVVGEPEALAGAGVEMARRLAEGGPAALRATKHLLNELDGSLEGGVVRRGAELSARVIGLEETRARLREKFGASPGNRP